MSIPASLPVPVLPREDPFLEYFQAPKRPQPVHEKWSDMIARTAHYGLAHKIDRKTFVYFLGVLPPRTNCPPNGFWFAEGAEPGKLFWWEGHDVKTGYYCRSLTPAEADVLAAKATTYLGYPIWWREDQNGYARREKNEV